MQSVENTVAGLVREGRRALLVYSGGMDSTTLLHEFRSAIDLCLSFDYGSKHNHRELQFAGVNCRALGVRHETVSLDFVQRLFKSDLLLSGGEIPEGHYAADNMKSTVVPFRNGIMLSVAAGIAESHGLGAVLIANHCGDHTIYPDCRATFINPMGEAIFRGSGEKVRLVAPYTEIDKRAIALRGRAMNLDYASTWSCYKGQELHCGRCGTCVERKEALEGFDPTSYAG